MSAKVNACSPSSPPFIERLQCAGSVYEEIILEVFGF
jgi:hypothetical protein